MRISRFSLAVAFLVILFSILAVRLTYLQIIKGKEYKTLSEKNFFRLITINPPRGKIFDRNGILLAYDVPYYELYAVPYIAIDKKQSINTQKKEAKKLLNNLEKYLKIKIKSKNQKIERLVARTGGKVVLKTRLRENQLKKFYTYSHIFKGVFVESIPRRKYTKYAKYLAHILGYVGYPSKEDLQNNPKLRTDMLIGKMGVEKIYNNELLGSYGFKAVIVDAAGRIRKVLWEKPPKEGNDIYLTIDARLQKKVYEIFKNFREKSGSVIIVNPKTYEILTLLSFPIFDIQRFSDGLSKKEWKNLIQNKYKPLFNKALNGIYPPGSIYKIVVSVSALEEGVITPYQKIYSGGVFSIGKWEYRNWNLAGCGNINVMQALEQSCDTFYYQVGLKLGVNKIVEWTYNFGIGEKLNPKIETRKSRVPSPDWKKRVLGEPWFHGDTVNLSIGQGYLGITPFDATKIVVPIANNGKVLKPQILKAIYDKDTHKFIETKPKVIRTLDIKKENLRAIKKGMYLVVYGRKGTAKILAKAPFKNAGKTGTAQVYRKPKKGESITKWELQNHAWFVDMFPYKNPKFVIATFVEHGKGGSKTAAPITLNIIKAIKKLGLLN